MQRTSYGEWHEDGARHDEIREVSSGTDRQVVAELFEQGSRATTVGKHSLGIRTRTESSRAEGSANSGNTVRIYI